jgi:hypothetical protein
MPRNRDANRKNKKPPVWPGAILHQAANPWGIAGFT